MAVIKPFQAVRPERTVAAEVAALPYDVYNRKEACEAVKGHPLSFLNIDRAETQFGEQVDTYADCVYEKANELLTAQREKGVYVQEETPCYYIYELTMDGRSQTGLVACSSVDEYLNGTIRKHENTRAEKEADRIRHVDTTSAQTGPIFLAYRNVPQITALINGVKEQNPSLYDFVSDDGIRHAVWKIEKPADVERLGQLFEEKVPCTYIADGHHRAASAVRVAVRRREEHPDYTGEEQFNSFLSVLFPDEQLMIMPYNRVVADLQGMNEEEYLAKIKACFDVAKSDVPVSPAKKGVVGMYLRESGWYKLTLHEELTSADPVEGLDVSQLQNRLLQPVLGINDPKTDHRIDFIGGIRGLTELERRVGTKEAPGDMQVAFSMYPTSIGELLGVADAGLLMPPKSTWFEPKLRSGLFIHLIER